MLCVSVTIVLLAINLAAVNMVNSSNVSSIDLKMDDFRSPAALFAAFLSLSMAQQISQLLSQEEILAASRAVISDLVEKELFQRKDCENRITVICRNKTLVAATLLPQYDFVYFTCGQMDIKGVLPDPWPFPAVKFSQLVDACIVTKLSTNSVCRNTMESVVLPLCAFSRIPMNRHILLTALDISIRHNTLIHEHNLQIQHHTSEVLSLKAKLKQSLQQLASSSNPLNRYLTSLEPNRTSGHQTEAARKVEPLSNSASLAKWWKEHILPSVKLSFRSKSH